MRGGPPRAGFKRPLIYADSLTGAPPRNGTEMSTIETAPESPVAAPPEDDLLPVREPLSDERLAEIASTLGDLPGLPDVALRAMRLAEDPDWDLAKLDRTIKLDQTLTARFLRLANSVFFGARYSITTLDRAINLVGITRVRSVLLAAALEGLHETKKSNFKGKMLWDHALAAGCISQHLATKHRRCDAEEAFMAGLLHDVEPRLNRGGSARSTWERSKTVCRSRP